MISNMKWDNKNLLNIYPLSVLICPLLSPFLPIALSSCPLILPFHPYTHVFLFLSLSPLYAFLLIKCKRLHESTMLQIDLFLLCVCVWMCVFVLIMYKLMQHCLHVACGPMSQVQPPYTSCFTLDLIKTWEEVQDVHGKFYLICVGSASMEATNSQNNIQPMCH